MPFYEYRCTKGHEFEVRQSMSDEPLTRCQVCTSKANRVLFAPAIHFKGTGFHNTDYSSKRRSAPGDDSSSGGAAKDGGSANGATSDSGASAAPAKESSSGKTVGLDKI